MPVAIQIDFPKATLQQYDEVLELMGLQHKGKGPAGSISHWVTQIGDGIRVVDVWESREAFDAFAQEQIGPFTAKVGIEAPPEMQFFEVHNYFTPG